MIRSNYSKDILRAQIRAGRELLSLKQADLALNLGVSASKISRIERGESNNLKEVYKIKHELERLGVLFTNRGLELSVGHIDVIEQDEALLRALDDVTNYLASGEACGDLLVMYASPSNWSDVEVERLMKLNNKGMSVRQIISSNGDYFEKLIGDCRVIPSGNNHNIVTLIYGDRVVTVNDENSKLFVQVNRPLADRDRCIFEVLWGQLDPSEHNSMISGMDCVV